MSNGLVVKVLNINTGLQFYSDIRFVRILSKKYNLLIMKNYLPIIGEVDGSIELEGKESVKFNNIKGYYINKNNEFNLIIKEDL